MHITLDEVLAQNTLSRNRTGERSASPGGQHHPPASITPPPQCSVLLWAGRPGAYRPVGPSGRPRVLRARAVPGEVHIARVDPQPARRGAVGDHDEILGDRARQDVGHIELAGPLVPWVASPRRPHRRARPCTAARCEALLTQPGGEVEAEAPEHRGVVAVELGLGRRCRVSLRARAPAGADDPRAPSPDAARPGPCRCRARARARVRTASRRRSASGRSMAWRSSCRLPLWARRS